MTESAKEFKSKIVRIIAFIVKLFFTVVAIMLFLPAIQLGMMRALFSQQGKSYSLSQAAQESAVRKPGTAPKVRCPWPVYPGAKTLNKPNKMEINNVTTISESFKVRASAMTLMNYYRQQMSARGWVDTTERTFGIKPEHYAMKDVRTLNNPQYVNAYSRIKKSNMVMRRGQWSLQILVSPMNDGPLGGVHRVDLQAVEMANITQFGLDIAKKIHTQRSLGKTGIMHMKEQMSTGTYDTQMMFSKKSPAAFYRDKLRELKRDDWRPMMNMPGTDRNREFFTLLQKGRQQAYLIVNGLPNGQRGSTATFTTITE